MRIETLQSRRLREAGYSITEIMVAVGVCGIVFTAVLTAMSAGVGILQTARQNLRATQVMQEKMETIRLFSWDQLNTPGFVPSTFEASADPVNPDSAKLYHGTIVITNAPFAEAYTPDMRHMIVEVTWGPKGAEHHRRMETFVSRHGLQNYVY